MKCFRVVVICSVAIGTILGYYRPFQRLMLHRLQNAKTPDSSWERLQNLEIRVLEGDYQNVVMSHRMLSWETFCCDKVRGLERRVLELEIQIRDLQQGRGQNASLC